MKKTVILSYFLISFNLWSQDVHFTMYDILSTSINSAQTGNFNGTYRASFIHRNQWRSVTVPFITTGLSFDAKSPFKKVKDLHVGLQLISDKAGDSHYSTFKLNPSVSYSRFINKDSTQQIRIGLQSGFTQRTINYSFLRFDSQYNGYIYDASLNSGENFARDSRAYGDLNLGLMWKYNPDTTKGINVGISWMNINKPQQTFYSSQNSQLDQRAVFTIDGFYRISSKFTLLPGIIFMPQGKYKEVLAGVNVKYDMRKSIFQANAVYAGGWLRAKDAYSLTVGMDYKQVHARASYDINFSDLTPASNKRGAFEFGIIYIYQNFLPPRDLKYKRCPDFM